jgi:hypothetical protein
VIVPSQLFGAVYSYGVSSVYESLRPPVHLHFITILKKNYNFFTFNLCPSVKLKKVTQVGHYEAQQAPPTAAADSR